jgi:hypothetical protein
MRNSFQMDAFVMRELGGLGLRGGNGAESNKERGVNTDGIIQERANDFLNLGDFVRGKNGGVIIIGSILNLGPISGGDPGVGGILPLLWWAVLKLVKHVRDVLWHRDVDKTIVVVPLDG